MVLCSLLRKSSPAFGEIPSNYHFRLHFRELLGYEGTFTSPFRSWLSTSEENLELMSNNINIISNITNKL